MTTDQQIAQVTQLLKILLQMSGIPSRQVEAQLGVSSGYLSYLLSGKAGLKLTHVLNLAAILKIHPHELFAAALGPTGASMSPGFRELQKRMPHLALTTVAEPPVVEPGPSKQQLEEQLRTCFNELLRRVFGDKEDTGASRF
jgi:transcriptional regulator with XRE-family HTH domain